MTRRRLSGIFMPSFRASRPLYRPPYASLNHFCTTFTLQQSAVPATMIINQHIKLLESPIPPPPPPAPAPSQKAHFDNISGTKRGSIDPLVSKRPEKNSE